MKESRTNRGFQLVEFEDRNEDECSLQQSSLMEFEPPGTSAIWLGQSHCKCGEPTRMHLDLEQVKELTPYLERWVKDGVLFLDRGVLSGPE